MLYAISQMLNCHHEIYIRPVLVDIKLQKSQLLILASAKLIVQDIFTSLLCDLKLSQPPKTQLVGDVPYGFRYLYISRLLGPPKCDQAPRSSLRPNQSFIVLCTGNAVYPVCSSSTWHWVEIVCKLPIS
jgi:hypothetical protein